MKTKVTVDRNFTCPWQMERTKEHAAEMREMWTPGDLLRMFREALENAGETEDAHKLNYCEKILRAEASAFPGGSMEEDTTHYSVDLLLESFRRFTTAHFYISHTGNVDTRRLYMYGEGTPRKMWDVDVYTLQK